MPQNGLLEHSTKFLAKREGIDKTLKLIRYSARLVLAAGVSNPDLIERLSNLESSLGKTASPPNRGHFLAAWIQTGLSANLI